MSENEVMCEYRTDFDTKLAFQRSESMKNIQSFAKESQGKFFRQ